MEWMFVFFLPTTHLMKWPMNTVKSPWWLPCSACTCSCYHKLHTWLVETISLPLVSFSQEKSKTLTASLSGKGNHIYFCLILLTLDTLFEFFFFFWQVIRPFTQFFDSSSSYPCLLYWTWKSRHIWHQNVWFTCIWWLWRDIVTNEKEKKKIWTKCGNSC